MVIFLTKGRRGRGGEGEREAGNRRCGVPGFVAAGSGICFWSTQSLGLTSVGSSVDRGGKSHPSRMEPEAFSLLSKSTCAEPV